MIALPFLEEGGYSQETLTQLSDECYFGERLGLCIKADVVQQVYTTDDEIWIATGLAYHRFWMRDLLGLICKAAAAEGSLPF